MIGDRRRERQEMHQASAREGGERKAATARTRCTSRKEGGGIGLASGKTNGRKIEDRQMQGNDAGRPPLLVKES